jgi:hypothetical protein
MMFPAMIAVGIAIVLCIVAREILIESRGKENMALRDTSNREMISPSRSLGVLAALTFYWFASEPLGFILSSFVMLAGLLYLFKVPRTSAVLVAIAVSIATYQVFAIFLRVPLPRGILEW